MMRYLELVLGRVLADGRSAGGTGRDRVQDAVDVVSSAPAERRKYHIGEPHMMAIRTTSGGSERRSPEPSPSFGRGRRRRACRRS